jgi:hypothetical protein
LSGHRVFLWKAGQIGLSIETDGSSGVSCNDLFLPSDGWRCLSRARPTGSAAQRRRRILLECALPEERCNGAGAGSIAHPILPGSGSSNLCNRAR